MKKILPNNQKTSKYLNSLPKFHVVVCWAQWTVISFPFSGKYYTDKTGVDIPLVYQYNDHNGSCDQYELVRIDQVTSGGIAGWTQFELFAKRAAEVYNTHRDNYRKENESRAK